jgi:hypothetical protein
MISTGQNLIGEALVPMTEASREMWKAYGEGLIEAQEETQTFADIFKDNFETIASVGATAWGALQSASDAYFTTQLSKYDEDSAEYEALQLKQFKITKATSIVNTGIAGAEAAIQAYKALAGIPVVGPGLGLTAAAGIGALTATQIGFISAQEPSFQTGTLPSGFTVPESSSTRGDSSTIAVQPGENVQVTPRGEGSGSQIQVNVIMNDEVLESQVQSLIDSNRLTFTSSNLRSA